MAESNTPCTLTLGDGTHYDLSSLSSASSDYVTKVGEREFKLNVCRAVVSELWNVDEPDKVGGFVGRDKGDFSLGSAPPLHLAAGPVGWIGRLADRSRQFNDTLLLSESTKQPMMYLAQGSACPLNPNEKASAAVRVSPRSLQMNSTVD